MVAIDGVDGRHLTCHIGLQLSPMAYVDAEYAVHPSYRLHLVDGHLYNGLLANATPDSHTQFPQAGVGVGSLFVCHFYDERQRRLLCRRQVLSICRHTLTLFFLLRHTNHCIGSQHTLRRNSQRIHH